MKGLENYTIKELSDELRKRIREERNICLYDELMEKSRLKLCNLGDSIDDYLINKEKIDDILKEIETLKEMIILSILH